MMSVARAERLEGRIFDLTGVCKRICKLVEEIISEEVTWFTLWSPAGEMDYQNIYFTKGSMATGVQDIDESSPRIILSIFVTAEPNGDCANIYAVPNAAQRSLLIGTVAEGTLQKFVADNRKKMH